MHEEIMESSDRVTKLFFKLLKNQRASSTADTQILRVEQNDNLGVREYFFLLRNLA
jgi:hypothetical protein